MSAAVRWLDVGRAEVSGVPFVVKESGDDQHGEPSDGEGFIIAKDPGYVGRCVDRFTDLAPRNIAEIGIDRGGSTVFWNLVLRPERHLAFGLDDRWVEPLHEFASGDLKHGRLDIRHVIDDTESEVVTTAVQDVFGDETIDLVIDGTSHCYAESRATFETLFPRLRPGATYVIEDWAWAHVEPVKDLRLDRPALTNLVVELMLVCGSRSGVVDEIVVESRAVHVTRGPKPLASPFRLADEYSNRGMPYRPLL
jgi:hypothetical protein